MVSAFPVPMLRWAVAPQPDRAQVEALATALRVPPALAALLIQRGHGSEEGARSYLRPLLANLSDPYRLAGMAEAVDVIARSVRAAWC